MKTKKAILTTFQVISIIALIALLVVIILFGNSKPAPQSFTPDENAIPPHVPSARDTDFSRTRARLDAFTGKDTSDENLKADIIAVSAETYRIACEKAKQANKMYAFVNCKTTMFPNTILEMPIQGNRFVLKTNTEFFFTEYSIPGAGLGGLASMFAPENTTFAMRSYADVSVMDYLYGEKSLSPKFLTQNADGTGDIIGIECYWDDPSKQVSEDKWAKEQKLNVFCAAQQDEYTATDQNITEETIKSAKIEYKTSEKGNYFVLTLELDTDNPVTTARSIDNLRKGANSADANYTSMVETIEIWENGYFKYFKSVDQWAMHGKKGGIASLIDYETTYYFDAEHTDPSVYMDFLEAKENALEYNRLRK